MIRKKPLNKKGLISPITKTTRPEKYNGGHRNLMNLTRDYVENKEKAALKNKQLAQAGVKDILEYGPDIEVRSNKIMSVGDIIKKQGEIRLKRDSIIKRKYRKRKDFSANNYTVKLTESELRLFSEFLEQRVFENQKGNDILNEWTPDYTGDLKQPWLSDGVEGVKKSREDRNKYQDKYQKSVDKAIQIAKKRRII